MAAKWREAVLDTDRDMATPPDEERETPIPTISRNSSFPGVGYFSKPYERWKDDSLVKDWASAFTLIGKRVKPWPSTS